MTKVGDCQSKTLLRVCCFCLEEVIPNIPAIESLNQDLFSFEVLDYHKAHLQTEGSGKVCSLCYGILDIEPAVIDNVLNLVSSYTEDAWFITVHVPDVIYLNFFLLQVLLKLSVKKVGINDSFVSDMKDLLSVFTIDTKLINIKEVFRNTLCSRLNQVANSKPNLVVGNETSLPRNSRDFKHNFSCETPLQSCLNVLILPPNPNLFTELLADSAVKPNAKKMKFSTENGNNLDRNCFVQSVNSALDACSNSQKFSKEEVYKLLASKFDKVKFQFSVTVQPLFIGGRYLKFNRTLSQTPWFIGGKRKGTSSIEELISEPLKRFFKCQNSMFRSSGREDIDVKMLGNGRPFAIELINPRITHVTTDQLEAIQENINSNANGNISVSHLHNVKRENLSQLRDGESEKTKEYLAVLYSKGAPFSREDKEKLTFSAPIEITQRTPLRVLHRRSLLDRKRHILWAKPELTQYGRERGKCSPPQQLIMENILSQTGAENGQNADINEKETTIKPLSEDLNRVSRDSEICSHVLSENNCVSSEKLVHGFEDGFSQYLTLRLLTDAGTYVKEWVHGDMGRSKPSVCDLLGRYDIDIVRLDVANVHLTWPIDDNDISTTNAIVS